MSLLRKTGLVLLLMLVLLAAAFLALYDPDVVTLSFREGEIDWDATARQLLSGELGLVRGRGKADPDSLLGFHLWDAGIITVSPTGIGPEGGSIHRLGDREELTERFGEDFEERLEMRGAALYCGEVALVEPTPTTPTNKVVARPRQLYLVHRTYGPRSTKMGRTEIAVIEILEHDLVRRILSYRRHPVR